MNYDLLLRHHDSNSFYIWRANSNCHRELDNHAEFTMELQASLLHDLAVRLLEDPRLVVDELFHDSHVLIDRVLATVCSFMQFR